MQWAEVLKAVRTERAAAAGLERSIAGVQYDSRRVGPGDLFVAMRGGTVDGNRFVDAALRAGAAAVLTDAPEVLDRLAAEGRAVALVAHGRQALAQASAAVFGHPERALALSAVTGTNGKTTTAWVLEQLLRGADRSCVLVGTIETHVAGELRESPHTTPESRDLLATFADGVRAGCTEAVFEASSHALEQDRLWGMPVDVAIWTNLTQDHLDFHGTMERYLEAKLKLFRGLGVPAPRVAVVNAEDEYAGQVAEAAAQGGSTMWRYGLETGSVAEFRAEGVRLGAGRTEFLFVTPFGSAPVVSPLTGRVNVLNLLAAGAAAMARGLSLDDVVRGAAGLRQVPGRFELVPAAGSGLEVVVDYAHTDDALRNLLELARELVRPRGGRVITVFGCGGDRDRTKRPKMGRAAGEGSDLVVVTSDNPRSEAPEGIIEEILPGLQGTGADVLVEEDRAGAIAIAIRAARPGDVVLIAGKGHEKVQIFADGAVPFDDVLVARGVLEEIEGA